MKAKLYKVRGWVTRQTRGKKHYQDHVFYEETVIYNNLDTAKSIYQRILNQVQVYYYGGYHGKAELFIPHIFEDGTLAYWPDNDKYILKFDSENVK